MSDATPAVCPTTCPKCGAEQLNINDLSGKPLNWPGWKCGSTEHNEFFQSTACQLRVAQSRIKELEGKVIPFLESVVAGPRGNADPGWEGDVRFAARIMEEADSILAIIRRS